MKLSHSLQICGTSSHLGFSRTRKHTLLSPALYDHLLLIHYLNHFCTSLDFVVYCLYWSHKKPIILETLDFISNFKYVSLELLWFNFFFLWFYICHFYILLKQSKRDYIL